MIISTATLWQLILPQVVVCRKKNLYLVIDDAVTKKTGKKMAGLGWHYSHTEGRKVWGHCYVTALYVIASFAYPVQVLLYQSKSECQEQGVRFKSKIDLAAEIIRNFKPVFRTRTAVLID